MLSLLFRTDPSPRARLELSRLGHRLGGALVLCALSACQPSPRPDDAFSASVLNRQRCNDGLVIEQVAAGKGPPARYGDHAQVHYIARVKGGAELSRSHDRKAPHVLVGRKGSLVEGLHRGLVGMKVGELRKIVVPKDLGYRGRKVPGVPPEAVLEFWVEMFSLSVSEPVVKAPEELCPS